MATACGCRTTRHQDRVDPCPTATREGRPVTPPLGIDLSIPFDPLIVLAQVVPP